MRHRRRFTAPLRLGVPALLLLLSLAGCAANPIRAWQRSVEAYVTKEGNGDLNVLRSVDRSPAEGDFGLLGAGRGGIPFFAPRRTDANGVLLGHRFVHDRGWFFFLVGTVERHGRFVDWPLDDPRVTDIRLIAMSGERAAFSWRVSEPDEGALSRYVAPQLDAWRASHPDRAAAETSPATFPTPADVLRLESAADAFTAVDDHSGARWTLPLWLPRAP